ncbi:MAG: tetratricopeptide repeat protein [Spirochaetota bacterium]|jgi:tetratricopeptide (TPR) repeat protein|nr:tetratricopeptide repeat protein [Spirochaetota bacterium]
MQIYKRKKRQFRAWDTDPPKYRFLRPLLILGVIAASALLVMSLLQKPDIYRDIQDMTKESRFEEAERLARSLYEKDPLDVRALLLLGRNYFQQAVAFDHQERGESETEEGWEQYQNAVEALKKAILLDKDNLLGSFDYFILGYAYLKRGKQHYGDALEYLRQAESMDAGDMQLSKAKDPFARKEILQQTMGYLYYQTGEYTNALGYYRLHNSKNPNILDHVYIGLCELALGEYSGAIANFRLVRDHTSQNQLKFFAVKQLARIYFHLEQYAEAENFFKSSVEFNTNYAEGFYWLGKLEEMREDSAAARRYWERSLEADPYFGPAILKLRFSPQHGTNSKNS